MTTFSIGVLAPRAGLWSVSVTTAWPGFIVCGALSLCHCSLAFPLNFDIHHQLCGHMCTWWLSDEKVARFHIQVWHIEEWKDARGVLVGKDSDIRTQTLSLSLSLCLSLSLSLICTHTHTTLGQQHRWVLGKQAAAGGGKDHKAGRLAKFHHLLWIAWDAHSTATRGMSPIHMQLQIYTHTHTHTHAVYACTPLQSNLQHFKPLNLTEPGHRRMNWKFLVIHTYT